MNPTGAVDPLYILARCVLLDALEALGPQRDAIILVGAQAVYLHTGPAGLAVPEYTTDADIALNPELLSDSPRLAEILRKAEFSPDLTKVGTWLTRKPYQGAEVDVILDLLVPASIGGPGRRGARLGPHGSRTARKAKGLEKISSLEPADARSYDVAVASPTALIVAKLHKINEREGKPERLQDKDALDVLRLLRSTDPAMLADSFRRLLAEKVSERVSREAVGLIERLFAHPDSAGSLMAARAAAPMEVAETTAASCAVLAGDLLNIFRRGDVV